MTIAVELAADQQIEGPRAVGAEDRSQDKVCEDIRERRVAGSRPIRTLKKGINDELVPLVECRKGALEPDVSLVIRLEIAVVVGHFINSLAESVASRQADITVEAFADLHDHAVVKSSGRRFVDIFLEAAAGLESKR